MKINNLTYLPQSGTGRVDQGKEAEAAGQAQTGKTEKANQTGADNVELSSRAREVQQAAALAKAAPDVRAERVAALKQQVASGKYQVDSMEVATKVVMDALARLS